MALLAKQLRDRLGNQDARLAANIKGKALSTQCTVKKDVFCLRRILFLVFTQLNLKTLKYK